ncbi:MAG: hypothetical protein L6437_03655 [Kiritimatiellae bacterium]|nr:hypothetical protein [Kiritimatiellia bacterium]
MRVSDEAILSDDLAGQHNPPGSQGPLDGKAEYERSADMPVPEDGTEGRETSAVVAYKREGAKVAAYIFPFEAVLGKTRRTEF